MPKAVKKAAKKKAAPKKKDKATLEHERRLEVLDPRQKQAMINLYDPASSTFGNFTRSFINAGFSATYADNITSLAPEWLSGFIGDDAPKLAKVERNLNKYLDLKTDKQEVSPTGAALYADPEKTIPKMIEDPRLLEAQMKATFFVAERLNRQKYGKDDKVNSTVFNFDMRAIREMYKPKPVEAKVIEKPAP